MSTTTPTANGVDAAAAAKAFQKDILSRTSIVKNAEESRKVVTAILEEAASKGSVAVAVDLEGIHLPHISLVQVKTEDERIHVFRTGLAKDIFVEGRLKELLEDPRVLKVMHASVSDCQALYKAGIKIWGLYDTAHAHKVIQFQDQGEPLISSKVISFNNICDAYNTKANPLKVSHKDDVWQRAQEFADKDPLPEDLTLYSACDVEPLLEVYRRTLAAIQPDFRYLLDELCEMEVVRSVDPELAKQRLKDMSDLEQFDVFLQDLPAEATKPELYEVLTSVTGAKKVLFAVGKDGKRSAHVVFGTRKSADQACRHLQESPNAYSSAKMLHEMRPEEIKLTEEEQAKFVAKLAKEGFALEVADVARLVAILTGLGTPLSLDFFMREGNALLEVQLGQKAPKSRIRFHLTKMSLTEGNLKSLFEDPATVKVVDRLDSTATTSALKILSSCGVKPVNFFDLTAAFRVVDFWYYGLTIFSGPAPRLEDSFKRLGLGHKDNAENRLIAHAELLKLLPSKCQEILQQKTQADADALCFVAKAAEVKKELKGKLETRAVHLYGSWGLEKYTAEEVHAKLEQFLQNRKLKYTSVTMLTADVAVVEMVSKGATHALAEAVRRERQDAMFNGRDCWVTPVAVFKVKAGSVVKVDMKAAAQRLEQLVEDKWPQLEEAMAGLKVEEEEEVKEEEAAAASNKEGME